MSSYDRSADRQARKSKKKQGGGQQPARKRKMESMFVPFRKLARTLKSSGAMFVARDAFAQTKKAGGVSPVENGLRDLARNGLFEEFGAGVTERAREAVQLLDQMYKAAGTKPIGDDPDGEADEGVDDK